MPNAEPRPREYDIRETPRERERMAAAAATAQYSCTTCGAPPRGKCKRIRGHHRMSGVHPERIRALLADEQNRKVSDA